MDIVDLHRVPRQVLLRRAIADQLILRSIGVAVLGRLDVDLVAKRALVGLLFTQVCPL